MYQLSVTFLPSRWWDVAKSEARVDPGADTMMMRLWQLELGMSYTNKQSLTEPIFQCWRILIKYLQTAETLADLRVVPYFVAESVSSTWRRCHNCLRLTQPLQRPSPSDAATNRKMFPNNNFPVSLQVSKQSQQSVTNTDSDHDQIFKTRKYYISTFPCESVTPRAASDQWLNIIAIIVIHLCNLFPWLPRDSPHLLLICLWCPGVHWTIMPLPASIHRKCSFDTLASARLRKIPGGKLYEYLSPLHNEPGLII